MTVQTVRLLKDSTQSVASLFALLSEHENMTLLISPAKVERVRSGDKARNGVGSVRLVKLPLLPDVEETVTAFQENELIEYKITNFGPMKNHLGVMRFTPNGNGSRLNYTITFESRIPFAGPLLRKVLESLIRGNLEKIR